MYISFSLLPIKSIFLFFIYKKSLHKNLIKRIYSLLPKRSFFLPHNDNRKHITLCSTIKAHLHILSNPRNPLIYWPFFSVSTTVSTCVECVIIMANGYNFLLAKKMIFQYPITYLFCPIYPIPLYSPKNGIPQETIHIPDFFYTSHTPNVPYPMPADVLLFPL